MIVLLWIAQCWNDAGRQWRQQSRWLLNNERGVVYSLSFVLIMPFYAMLIVMVVELALMFTARTGVSLAAHAAARAATVTLPADGLSDSAKFGQIQAAAVNTLAPFASARHEVRASTHSRIQTTPQPHGRGPTTRPKAPPIPLITWRPNGATQRAQHEFVSSSPVRIRTQC